MRWPFLVVASTGDKRVGDQLVYWDLSTLNRNKVVGEVTYYGVYAALKPYKDFPEQGLLFVSAVRV